MSPPGALSQRTDGRVPIIEATGLPYGDNKAVNDLQRAAPLNPPSGGSSGQVPASAAVSRQTLPRFGPKGIFGPTDRPGEPITAGIDWGPGPGSPPGPLVAEDPNLLLRAVLAEVGPHPDLMRLLARG